MGILGLLLLKALPSYSLPPRPSRSLGLGATAQGPHAHRRRADRFPSLSRASLSGANSSSEFQRGLGAGLFLLPSVLPHQPSPWALTEQTLFARLSTGWLSGSKAKVRVVLQIHRLQSEASPVPLPRSQPCRCCADQPLCCPGHPGALWGLQATG